MCQPETRCKVGEKKGVFVLLILSVDCLVYWYLLMENYFCAFGLTTFVGAGSWPRIELYNAIT